tara:strand:- start:9081 stop:9503 length:423 start_codon:yes stop_codon:yes gene_type:complete
MRYSILMFFLLIKFLAQSQNNKINFITSKVEGELSKINFIETDKLDSLLIIRSQLSKKTIKIYRIQLYSGNRNESINVENKFKKIFPDILTMNTYEQPYFKTKTDYFRTKLEALKIFPKIKKNFKNSFIYEENIDISNLE